MSKILSELDPKQASVEEMSNESMSKIPSESDPKIQVMTQKENP